MPWPRFPVSDEAFPLTHRGFRRYKPRASARGSKLSATASPSCAGPRSRVWPGPCSDGRGTKSGRIAAKVLRSAPAGGVAGEKGRGFARDPAPPVDHRAEDVENEGADAGHRLAHPAGLSSPNASRAPAAAGIGAWISVQ